VAAEFTAVFAALKTVLAPYAKRLAVKSDTAAEYALVTKSPSQFPQHKGHPMDFASIRLGKAYVSFHLMPIYMRPDLIKTIPPDLKKRMQGKTCFNFKTEPELELIAGLKQLTEAALQAWRDNKWL
jgi:hypothetical protein